MKKITYLSAIACIALTSCREEPADSGNQTIGVNPVVVPGGNISDVNQQKQSQSNFRIHYENLAPTYYPSNFTYVHTPDPSKEEELLDKIKEFTHIDNNNLSDFIQKIQDFEQYRKEKVSVTEATIQDNKLTFEILGVKGTMDLSLKGDSSVQQKQFDSNISAIQYLNARGGKLEFPLNINTFPLNFYVFGDSFGNNLDEIQKFNDNNHNKKFSVEKGIVKLDGKDFLKLNSLDDFQALAGALIQKSRHCFFDDTFKTNPITWKSNGEISFYGGENYVLFKVENNKVALMKDLSSLLSDLASMQKVGIPIDKIKIEQTSESIKLGGYPLKEDIWTNSYFLETLRLYTDLFDVGEGIIITEKDDYFAINNKPITKNDKPIENVGNKKDYFINNSIFKLEQAKL